MTNIVISSDQQQEYEKRRLRLIVPDPWHDPTCVKNGLVSMYIESTIAEIIGLSAESEPGVKLGCPNPIYTQYHVLISKCIAVWSKGGKEEKERTEQRKMFTELIAFLEKYLGEKIVVAVWDGYVPDIRLVNTIGEALGWLAHHYCM